MFENIYASLLCEFGLPEPVKLVKGYFSCTFTATVLSAYWFIHASLCTEIAALQKQWIITRSVSNKLADLHDYLPKRTFMSQLALLEMNQQVLF